MDKEPLANKSFFYNMLLLSAIILIIFGTIAWTLIIPTTSYQERMLQDYYEENGLQYKTTQIPIDGGISLETIAILPGRFDSMENEEVSAIILLNCMKNSKDQAISHMWSIAKQGFATFIINGRSYEEGDNTLIDFYGAEPWDVPKIIDFLVAEYPQINKTHFGVTGFNYGASVLLISQAIDSRIYASALYQPSTNISQLYLKYRAEQIPGDLTNYGLLQSQEIRDAYFWTNTTNTRNIMLIQGENDELTDPAETLNYYNYLNGVTTDTTQYIIRNGLNNQETIKDSTARKYAIIWFSHFFLDGTINLADLENEISGVHLYIYEPPNDKGRVDILNLLGFFAIELGAWFIFRFLLFQYQKRKEESQKKYGIFGDVLTIEKDETELRQKELKPRDQKEILRRFALEAAIIWSSSAIIGLIGYFTTPGVFFGIYIALPIVTLIALRYFQDPESRAKLQGFFTDRDRIRFTLLGLGVALGPILIAMLLNDYYASYTLQPTIMMPWRPASLFYYFVVILLLIWSYKCMEYFFIHKQRGALIVITAILAVSLMIFNFFIPILPNSTNFWWTVLSLSLMAISIVFLGLLVMVGRRLWGDTVVGTVFMAVILTILLSQSYYSILII